ncbi:hypothetical protein ACYCAX_16110 [Pseudomonas sp. MT3]|uniref:hypothetical protein n=1 Tax=Pseudomonas sp. ATCC 13867 TaxID=1294143 RepID=UPI0002C4E90D|nr:hypothetical protein [Pseudomonas sp. ATCC 13867]AGI26125.1 hypothetical protein H681_21290 [Pseudomonas sp. ATCC 13867]RFQ25884.1 hypothetical protein D0N87_20340 [Pseudomonas sp. ATCC 13867]
MRKAISSSGKSVTKSAKRNVEALRAQERLVRLKLQYELLDQRIGRVEEGVERPDCTLASLLMRRESLKYDMECQYRRLAG